jgi:two-component system osmolarity sensor histidine kinase EnvZ
MKLIPRTLQARIVLLILLLLVGSQYAAFRLFEYFELEPRASAGALQAVSTVNLTRAALLAASDDTRLALLRELNLSQGVRVYPFDPFEEIEPLPDDPLIRRIAEKVREQLGTDTVVAMNHLELPGVWVSFSIGGDDYWAVIPSVQTALIVPWQWLGWGAIVVIMSLLGAYSIMLRINRPLKQLAQAADAIGRGNEVQLLPEAGADEFVQVTRAFNGMNEALSRANTDRNLLLGGISHDLRTPLARLRLAVEMLPQASADKAGMEQDIADMDAIIGQFIDFVRGAEGEQAISGDLNALINELAARYMRQDKLLHLDLGALPELKIRPLAMRRLMTNLVDNAFHYGDGDVMVRTTVCGEGIVVSVMDNGPGLPEAEVERLLRPFERLDTARGRDGGSGLGLAIAARIAQLHGGELRLLNRAEGGLEARVILRCR